MKDDMNDTQREGGDEAVRERFNQRRPYHRSDGGLNPDTASPGEATADAPRDGSLDPAPCGGADRDANTGAGTGAKSRSALVADLLAKAGALKVGDLAGLKALIREIITVRLIQVEFDPVLKAAATACGSRIDGVREQFKTMQSEADQARRNAPGFQEAERKRIEAETEAALAAYEAEKARLWASCKEIATNPNLLNDMAKICCQLGVVGETAALKGIYLSGASRLAVSTISVLREGESSSGKNYPFEKILEIFPDEIVIRISSGSPLSLVYAEGENAFKHKIIYMAEAVFLARRNNGDEPVLAYLMRTFLSEGRLHHLVPVSQPNGPHTSKMIVQNGPVTFWLTNVKPVEEQLKTRLAVMAADESQEQLEAVVTKDRNIKPPSEDELEKWRDFQRWQQLEGPVRVIIPFDHVIQRAILDGLKKLRITPPQRLKRDINNIFGAIEASAITHRAQREHDGEGRLMATLDDYDHARVAFDVGLASLYGLKIPETLIAIVEAAEALGATKDVTGETGEAARNTPSKGIKISIRDLMRKAGLSGYETARNRLSDAVERGYLIMDQPAHKRAARTYWLGCTSDEVRELTKSSKTRHIFPTREEILIASGDISPESVVQLDQGNDDDVFYNSFNGLEDAPLNYPDLDQTRSGSSGRMPEPPPELPDLNRVSSGDVIENKGNFLENAINQGSSGNIIDNKQEFGDFLGLNSLNQRFPGGILPNESISPPDVTQEQHRYQDATPALRPTLSPGTVEEIARRVSETRVTSVSQAEVVIRELLANVPAHAVGTEIARILARIAAPEPLGNDGGNRWRPSSVRDACGGIVGLAPVVDAWRDAFGIGPVIGINTLAAGAVPASLKDALFAVAALDGSAGVISNVKLGHWLRDINEVAVAGLYLRYEGVNSIGEQLWSLRADEPARESVAGVASPSDARDVDGNGAGPAGDTLARVIAAWRDAHAIGDNISIDTLCNNVIPTALTRALCVIAPHPDDRTAVFNIGLSRWLESVENVERDGLYLQCTGLDDEGDQQWSLRAKNDAQTVGQFPAFLTPAAKQQLADLGYSRSEIADMIPADGHEIIRAQRCKRSAAPEARAADSPVAAALAALERCCPDRVEATAWRHAVEDGRKFVVKWGEQAVALGWTPIDIFGLPPVPANPHPSWRRLSRLDQVGFIWLLHGMPVTAITAECATISTSGGDSLTFRRPRSEGTVETVPCVEQPPQPSTPPGRSGPDTMANDIAVEVEIAKVAPRIEGDNEGVNTATSSDEARHTVPDHSALRPRCAQCNGEPDGKEQSFICEGKTILLHPECIRFYPSRAALKPIQSATQMAANNSALPEFRIKGWGGLGIRCEHCGHGVRIMQVEIEGADHSLHKQCIDYFRATMAQAKSASPPTASPPKAPAA